MQQSQLPKLGCYLCDASLVPGFVQRRDNDGSRMLVPCECWAVLDQAKHAMAEAKR